MEKWTFCKRSKFSVFRRVTKTWRLKNQNPTWAVMWLVSPNRTRPRQSRLLYKGLNTFQSFFIFIFFLLVVTNISYYHWLETKVCSCLLDWLRDWKGFLSSTTSTRTTGSSSGFLIRWFPFMCSQEEFRVNVEASQALRLLPERSALMERQLPFSCRIDDVWMWSHVYDTAELLLWQLLTL